MFEYKIIEDEVKSDYAFEVTADTLSELFKGAGLATMEAMVVPNTIEENKEWSFELKAQDERMLLYDFLSELIFLKDAETVLFSDFDIVIEDKGEFILSCKAKGAAINWEKDILLTDVKAVTMYEFKVEKTNGNWYCHVILDL
ncbi:MAG: archease [Candidatus Thorarchaeota archaeon]